MKKLKSLFLIAAVAAAVALPLAASAGIPVDINVPLPALPQTILTNVTWVTNTATAFQVPQGSPVRVIANVTGPVAAYASTNILGWDLSYDPGNGNYLAGGTGTNFTTGQPLSVTLVNDTNFGTTCTMSGYLVSTNFDGVTGCRLGKIQVIGTNTINWIRFETTR